MSITCRSQQRFLVVSVFAVVGFTSSSSVALAQHRVEVRKGRETGTAKIIVFNTNKRILADGLPRAFTATVPIGLAKRFVQAARGNQVKIALISHFWDPAGTILRAGRGKSAVVIQRDYFGPTYVKLDGKTYVMGKTKAYHTGRPGEVTGHSGLFRRGVSRVIDPVSLAAVQLDGKAGELVGSSLQWLLRKAPRGVDAGTKAGRDTTTKAFRSAPLEVLAF